MGKSNQVHTVICLLLLLIFWVHQVQGQQWKNIPTNIGSSFRGLSVVDDNVAWVSGTNGYVGVSTDGGNNWSFNQVKRCEQSDFRSIYAFDDKRAIIANAGAPTYIMVTGDGGINWTIVYKETDTAVFLDGIGFWDDQNGIIYGDPVDGRMLLFKTTDGGLSWEQSPMQSRPVMEPGEASFAASGTAVRLTGKSKMIIATGGKTARLLTSANKGQSWTSLATPMLHGLNSTGVFSVAFAGDKKGIIVGGDYKRDSFSKDHVFITSDGGNKWTAPVIPTGGYRECVEIINATTAIATGPAGTDITYDLGIHWQPLPGEKQFHVVRKSRSGNLIIFAGGGGKISVLKL